MSVLITEKEFKSQYIMMGRYSPNTLRTQLTFSSWVHEPKDLWVPCDAEGYVSRDLSTFAGDALCDRGPIGTGDPSPCPHAGGGEFVLSHDRTMFAVMGAGDPSVNGLYNSVPKSDDLFDSELYHGVPIYRQITCNGNAGDGTPCDPKKHVMAHRVIGSQKFWIITDTSSLMSHDDGAKSPRDRFVIEKDDLDLESREVFHSIKYSAWSEQVTPAQYGWRVRDHRETALPAPIVEPVVSSMHTLEGAEATHAMTSSGQGIDMQATLSRLKGLRRGRAAGRIPADEAAVGNIDAAVLDSSGYWIAAGFFAVVALVFFMFAKRAAIALGLAEEPRRNGRRI